MKITILGATGNVGRRIADEAVVRGHQVTGLARNLNKTSKQSKNINMVQGDASNIDDIIKVSKNQDVVVNAIRPGTNEFRNVASTTRTILNGLKDSDTRLIISGGAASLKVPGKNGTRVIDDPTFLPESARSIAKASLSQYRTCIDETDVDWVYLSPPAQLVPGERTGIYKIGKDELLVDDDGVSSISMEDFAIAILDEIEIPKHHQERFTVAN